MNLVTTVTFTDSDMNPVARDAATFAFVVVMDMDTGRLISSSTASASDLAGIEPADDVVVQEGA